MTSHESRIVTGIRPTGELTIANYVGAMKPVVEMQDNFEGSINLFVADLHGLTDQEPDVVNANRLDTVRSFLAAGADPERTNIYLQSQVEEPTVVLANYMDRHTTISELLRNPTLKDKLKNDAKAESINVALGRYPILMAADIFVQDADKVPVGEDQYPHIEFARRLARRFNNEYGKGESIIVEPEVVAVEALRILALNGDGKMSKSNPRGAIFLKDTPEDVEAKIKRAKTDAPGEMNDALESHFTLCRHLCKNEQQAEELERFKAAHLDGKPIMANFKKFMTELVNTSLGEFQTNYNSITPTDVQNVITEGGQKAHDQASSVVSRAKQAMGIL